MDTTVLVIFVLVYLGMVLGRLPGLALDRTGVALVGAIALLALDKLTSEQAWGAVDVPTIALLFGLMVISAQLRLGGFYAAVTRRLATVGASPAMLLALLIFVAGALSAVLANDIVCLAMTPVLIEGCARRNLKPVPFLLALACASNVGSAATLIGNPQNMLIGETLKLSFAGYLLDAIVPTVLGLAATWAIICVQTRGRWHGETSVPEIQTPAFDLWQTSKGLLVTLALVGLFLFAPWPRDVIALAAAGVLLMSRRMHTRNMLGLVDWQLLVLFIGLFIVNHALAASGTLDVMLNSLRDVNVDPGRPAQLFVITAILSNLVSNVPAVMLLLPIAQHPAAGVVLALSSTLAGNLFIVGSIANIIVVTQAAPLGVSINWKQHARVGVPVTIVTLLIAAAWLWVRFVVLS